MTPKRLRTVAAIIRAGVPGHTASTEEMADEIDAHADALEKFLDQLPGPGNRTDNLFIRLREPEPPRTTSQPEHSRTVFGDIEKTFPEASKGMR